jgi:hypothetical protein
MALIIFLRNGVIGYLLGLGFIIGGIFTCLRLKIGIDSPDWRHEMRLAVWAATAKRFRTAAISYLILKALLIVWLPMPADTFPISEPD